MHKERREVSDIEIVEDLNSYVEMRLTIYVVSKNCESSYIVPPRPPPSQSLAKEDEKYSDDDDDANANDYYSSLAKRVDNK
jgi:hypothetical protein